MKNWKKKNQHFTVYVYVQQESEDILLLLQEVYINRNSK